MISPLAVTWEAVSHDGTVLREREGARYRQIDRTNLKSFRLVTPGEILLETFTGPGRHGRGLCYRRRTVMYQETGRRVVKFLVGWVPAGPVYLLDPSSENVDVQETWNGKIAIPDEQPEEGEQFTFLANAHSVDARLKREVITVPSGMKLRV